MATSKNQQEIAKAEHIDELEAKRVSLIGGQLITEVFDSFKITSRNANGCIEVVEYYNGGLTGTLVATITITYDVNDQIESAAKT